MNEGIKFAAGSFDQAKSWIGNAFQRVASSITERRSQLQEASCRSLYPPTEKGGQRSATELRMFDVDFPHLNRLKHTCARAFGSRVFNGKRSSYADDQSQQSAVEGDVHDPLESMKERKSSLHSIRQTISLTTFESKSKEREILHLSSVEMETVRGIALQHQESVMSSDSGVNFEYRESIDTQQKYSARSNNSSFVKAEDETVTFHETNSKLERKDNTERNATLTINGTEEKEKTFSQNYSIFCEKLSNVKSEVDETSKIEVGGRFRSFSYHLRRSCMQKQKIVKQPCEKNDLRVTGRLKLSLQYFQKSRQLRVIVLCAESAIEHNKRLFCKVTLTGDNANQKEKTHKKGLVSGTAEFNECFYMMTNEDDLNGYVLRLQLRKVSRFLQRPSTVGEALITLEEFDINLDTTMWVNIRDTRSSKEVSKEEDIEITSENRSIHAEVMRLLEQSEYLYPRSPAMSRSRSLPQMKRNGITKRFKTDSDIKEHS